MHRARRRCRALIRRSYHVYVPNRILCFRVLGRYAVPPLPAPVVRAMRSFYTEQQAAADSARTATPAAAAGRAGASGAAAASAGSPPPVSALPPGHPSVPTDAPKCPYAHAH